ncbi:unnamed protein product [Orchesella dallaii]|uniref:EB domain-containing protein n=1 Tax=Orchesella dallaii TaxID=48710 RepID=A0ABP1Q423_9HEXA
MHEVIRFPQGYGYYPSAPSALLLLTLFLSSLELSISESELPNPTDLQIDSTPQTYYNKSCTHENNCLTSKTFLKCDHGICHCKKIDWYDSKSDVCRIRTQVGCRTSTSTRKHQDCVPYAFCKTDGGDASTDTPTSGVCNCYPNYYHDDLENLCVANAGVYGGGGVPQIKVGNWLVEFSVLSILLVMTKVLRIE